MLSEYSLVSALNTPSNYLWGTEQLNKLGNNSRDFNLERLTL